MTEQITARQFHFSGGVGDWRVADAGACAHFRTDSFATGARLVQAISELPGLGDHAPDVDLRPDGVFVRLFTTAPAPSGLSTRDVEMARLISSAAQQLRLTAEPAEVLAQVVHGDPTFDAFVLDAARVVDDGMIDWSATMGAPALYDLGTVAAVYRRHPGRFAAFLRGYLDVEPAIADQLRFLETFTRLRWMCTALYFADRIARGIVRGGPPEANRLGLAEAHCELNPDAHG